MAPKGSSSNFSTTTQCSPTTISGSPTTACTTLRTTPTDSSDDKHKISTLDYILWVVLWLLVAMISIGIIGWTVRYLRKKKQERNTPMGQGEFHPNSGEVIEMGGRRAVY